MYKKLFFRLYRPTSLSYYSFSTMSINSKLLNVSSNTGPLTDNERQELSELISKMTVINQAKPSKNRFVRQSTYDYEDHKISSWKCTEYLYKKDPCPLPTQARGLFTEYETVIARGYDKFFNVGEVSKTKWSWIKANTEGPYELTVKENGCLILAAGIDEGSKLLVTSKHAINVDHANVGTKWVHQHLEQAGKTTEELASFLYSHNATAVFELCDDDFEEHILEYPEKTRGLYLHGINRNSLSLDTWPSSVVTEVAEDFGFHVTKYFTFASAEEGEEFADRVRHERMLDGRAIEGFVVRCQIAGTDMPFMFKIKYDEPYLMFREWREMTKRILGGKPFRTTYKLSKLYGAWAKQQINRHPEEFEEFTKNKGIIGARQKFLEYHKEHGGSESAIFEELTAGTNQKVLIVPVASIGCGKTTVALALGELFGFGHIQNDDVPAKKNRRNVFHSRILNEFEGHDFVFADRNNHLPILRETLTTAVRGELPNCRIIALYWSHEGIPHEQITKTTQGRVQSRGESHQTLTPQNTPSYKDIMQDFLKGLAPVDLESRADSLIEDIIELDPLAESGVNLRTAIQELCRLFPDQLAQPTEDKIKQALDNAFRFKPTARIDLGGKKANKPQYFGLKPEDGCIEKLVEEAVSKVNEKKLCQKMLKENFHSKGYHITMAHIGALKRGQNSKDIFNGYKKIGNKNLVAQCTGDYIVCNGENMALRIKSMCVEDNIDKLPPCVVAKPKEDQNKPVANLLAINKIPHITLALSEEAKAVKSNKMLQQVFGQDNADAPLNYPCGWEVIPVTLSFTASLTSFTS